MLRLSCPGPLNIDPIIALDLFRAPTPNWLATTPDFDLAPAAEGFYGGAASGMQRYRGSPAPQVMAGLMHLSCAGLPLRHSPWQVNSVPDVVQSTILLHRKNEHKGGTPVWFNRQILSRD